MLIKLGCCHLSYAQMLLCIVICRRASINMSKKLKSRYVEQSFELPSELIDFKMLDCFDSILSLDKWITITYVLLVFGCIICFHQWSLIRFAHLLGISSSKVWMDLSACGLDWCGLLLYSFVKVHLAILVHKRIHCHLCLDVLNSSHPICGRSSLLVFMFWPGFDFGIFWTGSCFACFLSRCFLFHLIFIFYLNPIV